MTHKERQRDINLFSLEKSQERPSCCLELPRQTIQSGSYTPSQRCRKEAIDKKKHEKIWYSEGKNTMKNHFIK